MLLSIDSNRDTAFALDLESKLELVAMFFKPVTIDWKLLANRMIESCRCTNLVLHMLSNVTSISPRLFGESLKKSMTSPTALNMFRIGTSSHAWFKVNFKQ